MANSNTVKAEELGGGLCRQWKIICFVALVSCGYAVLSCDQKLNVFHVIHFLPNFSEEHFLRWWQSSRLTKLLCYMGKLFNSSGVCALTWNYCLNIGAHGHISFRSVFFSLVVLFIYIFACRSNENQRGDVTRYAERPRSRIA